jgi:uncharacterized membrane protein
MSGGFTRGILLGQADGSIFVWAIVLILILVVMLVAVAWLRRRLSPHEDFQGEGFSLGDLRRLHKSGQLTDEEFEKARNGLIMAAHASQQRKVEEEKNRSLGLGGPR